MSSYRAAEFVGEGLHEALKSGKLAGRSMCSSRSRCRLVVVVRAYQCHHRTPRVGRDERSRRATAVNKLS
jgi:flavin-dependent dehydrogenase